MDLFWRMPIQLIVNVTTRKEVIMLLDSVPPPDQRLNITDTFTFSCHSGLDCFNRCWRNKHLPLTPYDVLRLKTALGHLSDDFLSKYTLYSLAPDSGFPIISLRMGDDPHKECPFVGRDGCRVYKDRPTACRLYPLGRASGKKKGQTDRDGFFFKIDTPACLGVKEKKVCTVEEWMEDQGPIPYITMNDKMLGILFHPGRVRTTPLNEGQIQKVMVACYNLDLFREFIFKTRFLESLDVDEDILSTIRSDDSSLLDFAFHYLDRSLFPDHLGLCPIPPQPL